MTKKIALVCDSTADFPPGMVNQLGLNILPVHISLNGKDYLHGKSITNSDVINALRKKGKISTSPFFPFECTELYDLLLKDHDEVLSFHLSNEISGNYKSACSALKYMGEQESKRIHVFDLGSVGISLGLVVKKAIELLKKGVAPAQLPQQLEHYMKNVFLGFTVDSLTWLKKGGRVSAFDAFVGNMLDFKPIIQLENTRLVATGKHRGKKAATDKLLALAEETYNKFQGKCETWMAHSGNLDEVMLARERLAVLIGRPTESIPIAEAGATVSAHTGPGGTFIGILPE